MKRKASGLVQFDRAVFDRAVFDRAVFDRAVFDRAVFDRAVVGDPELLDPATQDDPFDLGARPDASEHIAFGFGNHFCIGAWLARTELRTAFGALLDRLDEIVLARPLDAVPHEFSFFLRPMKELPICFAPVR